MSEKGAVQQVKDKPWNGKTFWSMKVNGEWYSTGLKTPPEEGTYVEFEWDTNARGYKDVKGSIRQVRVHGVSEPQGTKGATQSARGVSRDDYWLRKDERDIEWQRQQREVVQPKIELQAARNAAIEVVKILVAPINIDGKTEYIVKPPAQAKRKEWVEAMITEITHKFVEENNPALNLNNPGKGATVDEQIAAMAADEPAVEGWE